MGDSYIIAVDFGTTFSGYAYSLTPRNAEITLHLKTWGKLLSLQTTKTPTCILFDEQEEFLKFGFEAKMAYNNMRGEEAQKCFFFEGFKMALYGTKVNSHMMITAANGKSMKALKVFTAALSYMKEDALRTISKNTAGKMFVSSDFTWVLTVPAIWDPSAKQFMREAATQAGIVTEGSEDKLVIALEPEAASLWCKKLSANGFITEEHGGEALDQSAGTQYIVVDCGGGTIDITVHEVLNGGALKELHKASGNNLGGQTIDANFKLFLREIFSGGVWDEYEKKYPGELQKMMYDFTFLKKTDEDVQMICPYNLGLLAQKHQGIERFLKEVKGASWDDGWIKISRAKLRSFFDDSLTGITNSLREILRKELNIQVILLVGGYADSQILRQHIIDEFGHQCKVLCPIQAQEAIMKGAVMFGRNPAVVKTRKSTFTYGLSVSERFDESRHKNFKKYSNKDGDWCIDIFMKLVEIDEDVSWDETREHILYPVDGDDTRMKIRFYRTERRKARYVDEWGIEEAGSFYVNMPDTKRGMNRQVKLELRFGSTEITATGTDKASGSTKSIKMDFMTK
ncbi:hypothetical protein Q5P01_014234 [Channa striata]|uniref:Heat shock 70 kDa protein 12A n=1 Tax=Channa striata TaxID=64152 RepID=A0AA88SLA1_CHASR|nr:hypothetical protein Q5P01_014234 [Channa striata]